MIVLECKIDETTAPNAWRAKEQLDKLVSGSDWAQTIWNLCVGDATTTGSGLDDVTAGRLDEVVTTLIRVYGSGTLVGKTEFKTAGTKTEGTETWADI